VSLPDPAGYPQNLWITLWTLQRDAGSITSHSA